LDTFPIENGLEQGDNLSPLLFNFVLGYAISKVKKKTRRLWNWIGHMSFCSVLVLVIYWAKTYIFAQ